MTKIRKKQEDELTLGDQEEKQIDDKLELLKFMSQVQSTIKDTITEDFVFAKLGDQDKEAIIEMTTNAYYGKKILKTISKTAKQWHWNNQTQAWTNQKLQPEQQKIITQYSENLFDAFMIRPYMTVILNRNVPKNPLIRILANATEQDEDEEETQETQKIMNKIKNMATPKEENKQ